MAMAVDIWDAAVVVIIADGAEAADITMVGVGNPRSRAPRRGRLSWRPFSFQAAGQCRPLAQNGHGRSSGQCPVLGGERKSRFGTGKTAFVKVCGCCVRKSPGREDDDVI
jgi:hypothetical protein